MHGQIKSNLLPPRMGCHLSQNSEMFINIDDIKYFLVLRQTAPHIHEWSVSTTKLLHRFITISNFNGYRCRASKRAHLGAHAPKQTFIDHVMDKDF